jgi:aconitate hydratase 2/2-methylisocitrate dehydratase
MGDGARVYLGSAELGAICALKEKIPTKEEYLAIMTEKILPQADKIYRYLQFDEMKDLPLHYSHQY